MASSDPHTAVTQSARGSHGATAASPSPSPAPAAGTALKRGLGGEGYTSFTIASPTGEGLTTAVHFTRERRCTLKDSFRFV